jgi:hypothetical protein
MPFLQLTDWLIVDTNDVVAAVRTKEGGLRLIIRNTWREIEVAAESAERAWAVLTSMTDDQQAPPSP